MIDLISRKEVDNVICNLIDKLQKQGLSMSYDMDEIIELQMEVENIPTAYDVDKVVAQLCNSGICYGNNMNGFVLLSKAIPIVKGAFKNE